MKQPSSSWEGGINNWERIRLRKVFGEVWLDSAGGGGSGMQVLKRELRKHWDPSRFVERWLNAWMTFVC